MVPIQLVAAKVSFKLYKNDFFYILEALCVLRILQSLSWVSGHAGKQLDVCAKKVKVDFKIGDVKDCQ